MLRFFAKAEPPAPPAPPPSPSQILVGLIANDILRHAHEWDTIVTETETRDRATEYVLKRKGYAIEFVQYSFHDDGKFSIYSFRKIMGVQFSEDETKFLAHAISQAKKLYQAKVDAENAIKEGLEANAKEAARQMAACDAIERFMTWQST